MGRVREGDLGSEGADAVMDEGTVRTLPVTLRHLADAIDALLRAYSATKIGFTADHCVNAMREIESAVKYAFEEIER